jgi:hypothetical protein
VIEAYNCKHFSLGLPAGAPDQSLTALFQHVATTLAGHEPIRMDDVITVGFETELSESGEYQGTFTIVFGEEAASTS